MRREAVVLALLGVAVAAWVALGTGVRGAYGAQTTADEPQYLLSAISLAEDRDLDIGDELRARRWRAFHSPAPLPVQTKVLDAGGRQVSPHDPLLPAVLALPVWVGGWVAAKLALSLCAGLLAALLAWVAWRRLEVPFGLAVGGTAVFAAAPPVAVYGTQVYPELPAALVVTAAVALLTGPLRGRAVWLLAACVTALPWLSVKYVAVAAALAAVGVWRLWRAGGVERAAAWRLVGVLAASGVLYVLAHRVLYGGWTVYAAGDHFTGGEATVMGFSPDLWGRSRRLAGLLTDREFGLIPWAPVYLLAVPALPAAVRARRAWLAPVALPLAAGWLMATFAALTMHGWWWPGRQVVVVLPCAVLAVLWWAGRVLPAGFGRWLVGLLGAAGVVTFLWLAVEGLSGSMAWVVDFAETPNPLYRMWRPLLPDGTSTAPAELARHVLWVGVLGVLAVAGWRSAAARRHPVAARPAAASVPTESPTEPILEETHS